MPIVLTQSKLNESLSLTDLTTKHSPVRAMQCLIQDIHTALAQHWQCKRQVIRTCPVVPVENNYDRLGYPADGAARDERYSRYISDNLMLRTQTSAAVPDILEGLSIDPPKELLLGTSKNPH